ncbi:MAG: hypothetical protein AAF125_04630 [Chloroflexota bacterium]
MTELYDRIMAETGTMRNWMTRIPGLETVVGNNDRRTADRMLREHIAKQLQQRVDRFAAIEKQMLKSLGMSVMSETREAKSKLQVYVDKVKAAAPGYSGFFAAVNIDEEAMRELAAFDEAQLRYVDKVNAALDTLDTALSEGESVDAAVQGIYSIAEEAIRAFSLREDVLVNLNQKYS